MQNKMEIISKKWAIVPFALFQMVALSTYYYIVPQLIVFKMCHKQFNTTVCNQLGQPQFKEQEDIVYVEAAAWNAMFNFAGFFPATIMILPLGAMTDFVSKKKMLLVPAIASLISCLINLFSSIFITLHVGVLVLSSFITSILGEEPGCITLCCVYAASAGKSEERTLLITMAIAAVEAGKGIGSLIGNYLKRYYGFTSVFQFATAILIVCLLYTLILIPSTDDVNEKSLQKEQNNLWTEVKERTKETFFHLIHFSKKYLLFPKDKTILLLLFVVFFNFASYGGERALITLFLKHSPLDFKADQIGIYLTLYQSSRTIGVVVLALVINRYTKVSDYTLMFWGTLSKILKYAVLSSSTAASMVYISTIPACPVAFLSLSARSQLTKLVSIEEHGVILSFVGLAGNSSIFIMSVAANGLFAATAKVYSGFGILLLSFSNIVSFAILCCIVCARGAKGITSNSYRKVSIKDSDRD